MADKKWTAAQSAAINHAGGNLLVSAAAGSGKTATLTERIIRLLTEDGNGCDVSRMLVVTFTKAAAGELKDRIRKSLGEVLKADKENRRVARQQTLLPTADICTIHSFCLKILRTHFTELGLPPDFTVADEGSMNVLKAQIMRDSVSEYYNAAYESGDTLLADVLGGSKSEDALDSVLLSFAATLESHGFGGDKLDEYAEMLERSADKGFLASPHGEKLREVMLRRLDYYIRVFMDSLSALTENDALKKNYIPAAEDCLDFAERLRSALEKGDYATSRALIMNRTPARLGAVKNENQTEAALLFKSTRETFAKDMAKLGRDHFSMTEAEVAEYTKRTAAVCRAAAPVITRYFSAFSKAKRDRGTVDFGDLENLACKLLYGNDGEPTKIADEISAKYDYVFIDEYQDTNFVQDRIFSAVSRKSGRFLVGDIKQSIYRFRGAEPQVFASYREKWNGSKAGESVFMSENFRCDECVVDFVNLVSRYMFSSGAVPFSKEDELVHAKGADAPVRYRTEVKIISTDKDDDGVLQEHDNPEAEYVADRIAGMIGKEAAEGGRLIRGGDIAILLRSPSSCAQSYISALARRGIRTENSAKTDFFTLPEILLALSVMNAVDNPMRDIYLAGAMMSPIYRFTADDLVKIRAVSKKSTLWQAVRTYSGDAELENKCSVFVSALGKLRRECSLLTADAAVRLIYEKTGLPEFDYGTVTARGNLMTLYDMARRIESGVFVGLYGFVSHLGELAAEGGNDISLELPDDPDAVHIVSIHHSKGLEYPICFVAESAHRFNMSDSSSNLIFDTRFGPAMRLPDESGLLRIDTPVRQAAALKITQDTLDEEMRNLYVAMTRARCHLIVTAKMKSPCEKYAAAKNVAKYSCAHTVYSARSYIDWIIGALSAEETEPEYVSFGYVKPSGDETVRWSDMGDPGDGEVKRGNYRELIGERLSFVYPEAYLGVIPAKLTVSKLTPDILDTDDTVSDEIMPDAGITERSADDVHNDASIPVPVFLTEKSGYTPAEAGIATHLFMQFCDFSRLSETGAEEELRRLTDARFLSPEIAVRVNMREIAMFTRSKLFARIKTAREIRREFRFNAAMPASGFTKNGELAARFDESHADVIVQGVIDCVITDADGKLVLIDYKTDRFPRTAGRDEVRRILAGRHRNQLSYYRDICGMMYGRQVDETYVYSLYLGEEVEIK